MKEDDFSDVDHNEAIINNLCSDLCSYIVKGDYEKIADILNASSMNCDIVQEKLNHIYNKDDENSMLLVGLRCNLQSQNAVSREPSIINFVVRIFTEYLNLFCFYSYMHAIYNIGARLQNTIVYNPELINEIEPFEASQLIKIYKNGYAMKYEFNEYTLGRFANNSNEKFKIIHVDKVGRVTLTNMGLNFIKMEFDRIIVKVSDDQLVSPSVDPYNEEGSAERDFAKLRDGGNYPMNAMGEEV